MSVGPLHSVSVAGVVVDDRRRVLVVKRRDNGQWQAPGGVLELEETLEEGVAREVLEETGVRVEVERITGIYKNLSKAVVAIVFKCRPLAGQPRPTDESTCVEWLDVADAVERMLPAFAVRVQDAVSSDLQPTSRSHDGTNLL
ncbi:NUDIX domain-containing protein [Actinomycetospora sp. CA-053990]|uniref:NUDIX domain-containing protein n=1 Tax=Actinomycetospora sp. CA-053990 TaxID=3239891 RepID=UPI003D908256